MEAQIGKVRHALKLAIGDARNRGRPPRDAPPLPPKTSWMRDALDRLGRETGLVYDDDLRNKLPRDAEIVRVLLVARLLSDRPVGLRVAVAVYCNSLLDLSSEFARVLYLMKDNIWKATELAVGLQNQKRPLAKRTSSKRRTDRPNRSQVYLILDDWLRASLENVAATEQTTDTALIKGLLQEALADTVSIEVLRRYARVVGRVQGKIREALQSEQEALIQALKDG